MVNKSRIDAVFPGEVDAVVQILDLGCEYDQVMVERDEGSFIEIFNNPGSCCVVEAVAIDASGLRRPIPSEHTEPMAALGAVYFHPETGMRELVVWSRVIGVAAEIIFSNESDLFQRLGNLINSSLGDAELLIAVKAMYAAEFWDVLPIDSELDPSESESPFVLKGKTRMLVGYEAEFDRCLSNV